MAMLVEQPRPRVIRDHPHAGWFAVATVCFGAFMGQLDASIVTLTFPALQHEFGQPLAAVEWVSLAYLLGLVGLLAAAGRLADAAGRKLMYIWGFGVFTAASVACGLAPGLGWLIGFRVVQAVGAAMLQANSVALVVNSVPAARRRSALGVQAAAQALGLALGPALGGLLVSSVGWRWVFLVNLPVGVLGLVAGRFLLPRTRQRTALGRFDTAGLVLLAVGSTALLLALSGVSGLRLPGWVAALLVLIAVASVVAFRRRERRAASPLVDLDVLRPAAVSLGLLGALCGYLVLFGPLALFPQTLGTHGAAGLVLTCLPAGFGVAAVGASWLLPRRLGSRGRAVLGSALCVVGCGVLPVAPGVPGLVGPLLLLVGFGLGVFIPANNSSIMGAIPERMSATGGGLVNMARGLGTALGVALVTLSLHVCGGVTGRSVDLALFGMALVALIAGVTGLAVTTPRSGQE
ncbi:MFS transporter [Amycolatopsis acidiphila]|uniref:MFS transporter n=1 Tax=Amycolatopsis acidiphila TaxID=715473 RepID=A0A558AIK5_9PSEU|nr:MFS transporter [Amycolatopsis acidiphila]TVT24098.1 MFS transporter [Amycolatopsis acidiphila]UIJ57746.1 MFS transporter [Amycolatopsis acidiphila]GHG87442.1 MFS transporter [Amycolatopsis acidiphila]